MHIHMLLDHYAYVNDALMYDAYICDPWYLTMLHVSMMRLKFCYERTDGRTDERTRRFQELDHKILHCIAILKPFLPKTQLRFLERLGETKQFPDCRPVHFSLGQLSPTALCNQFLEEFTSLELLFHQPGSHLWTPPLCWRLLYAPLHWNLFYQRDGCDFWIGWARQSSF